MSIPIIFNSRFRSIQDAIIILCISTTSDVYSLFTYIRSILIYNSSSWSENANTKKKIDSIHRKHLRRILKISYPKIISNSELYKITRTENLSIFVAKRRKTHWGHILRHNEAFKKAYLYLSTIPMKKCHKMTREMVVYKSVWTQRHKKDQRSEISTTGLRSRILEGPRAFAGSALSECLFSLFEFVM